MSKASVKDAHNYTHILGLVVAHELEGEAIRAMLMAITGGMFPGSAAGKHDVTVGTQEAWDNDSRVRTSALTLASLIREAAERSATFQKLLAALEASDGLVYIEPERCGVNGARACLAHRVTVAGPNRILHILVDLRRPESKCWATRRSRRTWRSFASACTVGCE